MREMWIHKKTGNVYIVTDLEVINCTNAANDETMVLYENLDGKQFVREKEEFLNKFEISENEKSRHGIIVDKSRAGIPAPSVKPYIQDSSKWKSSKQK